MHIEITYCRDIFLAALRLIKTKMDRVSHGLWHANTDEGITETAMETHCYNIEDEYRCVSALRGEFCVENGKVW